MMITIRGAVKPLWLRMDEKRGQWTNALMAFLFSPAYGGGKQENLQCVFPLPKE